MVIFVLRGVAACSWTAHNNTNVLAVCVHIIRNSKSSRSVRNIFVHVHKVWCSLNTLIVITHSITHGLPSEYDRVCTYTRCQTKRIYFSPRFTPSLRHGFDARLFSYNPYGPCSGRLLPPVGPSFLGPRVTIAACTALQRHPYYFPPSFCIIGRSIAAAAAVSWSRVYGIW